MSLCVRLAMLMGLSCTLAGALGCSSEAVDGEVGASESAQVEASAASHKALYAALAAVEAAEDGTVDVRIHCRTSDTTSQSSCAIDFASERPTMTVNGSAKALYETIAAVRGYPSKKELWGDREVFEVHEILCSRSERCFLRDAQGRDFAIVQRADLLRGLLSNLNVQYASQVTCSRTKQRDERSATFDHECKFKQFDDDHDFFKVTEGGTARRRADALLSALRSAGIGSFPGGHLDPGFQVTKAVVKCRSVAAKVSCTRVAEGTR